LCVDGKVEDDELDLIRIDQRRPRLPLHARLEADRVSDRGPKKIVHAGEKRAEVDGFRQRRVLARESKKLLIERGAAPDGTHGVAGNLRESVSLLWLLSNSRLPTFAVRSIVEVMLYGGGELAQGLDFLGPDEAPPRGAPFPGPHASGY
jgi:hypothetical protein